MFRFVRDERERGGLRVVRRVCSIQKRECILCHGFSNSICHNRDDWRRRGLQFTFCRRGVFLTLRFEREVYSLCGRESTTNDDEKPRQ